MNCHLAKGNLCSRRLRYAAVFAALAVAAHAQTVTATLAAGTDPTSLAVNPVTNKIYVANSTTNNVTVIDGATNNVTTVTDPNAADPSAVAVNPVTNKIYVANAGGTVTVIDGATNNTTSVTAGTAPSSVAVNPVTNKVYVTNSGSSNVTVIDGATNNTTTVAAGTAPQFVAVNPVTNKVYVANDGSGNVTVIDGATNGTTTVAAGTSPYSVAVNPVTNQIYVANNGGTVTVIDGATNNTTSVTADGLPYSVAVNAVTNQIYVANLLSGDVTVIDGASNTVTATVGVGSQPASVAVNSMTNEIYVANLESNNVTVINGATNATTTVTDANASQPRAVAVNPVTDKIYVANSGSNNVTIVDGATNSTTTVTAGGNPSAVAANPVTNQIYVVNNSSKNVTVIDGATNNTLTVAAGKEPVAVAVNPVTKQVYVANQGNNVTVIDGATNNTTTVAAGNDPLAVAVNPVTNQVYVANGGNGGSGNVTVIDGATNSTTTVADPNAGEPIAVAVNPITNKIYVSNFGSGNVSVIDGVTNNTATVATGNEPVAAAVNPVTNKIYVANFHSNNVTVIDGATNNTVTVDTGKAPRAVSVNPVTNQIYVTNSSSNTVTVIDGATNNTTTVPVGGSPTAVAVNPVTNKIYVANAGNNNVTVIDGATNTTTTVTDPNASDPDAVAVNPVTNQIYVANNSNNVTVIAESAVQAIPLQASIASQTNNQVTGATVAFSFTASSSFSPTAPPPDGLYYQLDTWQGPWQPSTSAGSNNFTGNVSGLAPGTHILYAYATDGQDATSTNTGLQSSPLIGNITAYLFLALAPTGTPSVVSESPNGAAGPSQTFVLTYSDTGGSAALQSVAVNFNATPSTAQGCVVYYDQVYYNEANSALYLANDAGTALLGPLTPGSSGTLSNSQCTIKGTGSSVSASGDNFTLNLSVTASGSFAGTKNIYMLAQDNSEAETAWIDKGTWTPAVSAPSVMSVSPNSSIAASQTFALEYSDNTGYASLNVVAVIFNTTAASQRSCYVYYAPATNRLYLQNDAGTGATFITIPSSGTLSNSQCTISGSGTSVGTSDDTLTLNLAVAATTSFEGPKNIYMYARDNNSANTGWVNEGAWSPSASFTPSVGPVPVMPNPASGPTQTFALEYSDTGGNAALTSVAALFNATLSSVKACYVYYVPQTNLLYLQNDSGQGATSITPGSGTLTNGQCSINGSGTSVMKTSGSDTLTLNLDVTGIFTGTKQIFMRAADDSSANSGWVDAGTWTP